MKFSVLKSPIYTSLLLLRKMMLKTHSFPLRVYIEDTDAEGMVYYANYLKFAERARTECLRSIGINHAEMIKKDGLMFVVRSCHLNCLASGRLDDVLEIKTHFKKVGGVKVEVSQSITRETRIIATLGVFLAGINFSNKPVKLCAPQNNPQGLQL